MNQFTYRRLRLFFVFRKWLRNQFTPTGIGVLVCWLVSAIVGLGSTQSMCHLLFFLSSALLILAAIGTRSIQYRFKVMRLLPRFGTVGEPLQYRVVIQNLTPQAQSSLKLVETIPEPFPSFREYRQIREDYPVGRQWRQHWRKYLSRQRWAIAPPQDLPILSAETKTKANGEVLPLRRGRLSFDAMTLACPDPLGLIYKRQTYDVAQSVCILPKRYQLPPLNLSQARRYQMGASSLVSSVGESLEFRSLRDYRPGDATNKIHWKSWAKVGRPIVKEQLEESGVHHALILDTFQMEFQSELFEAAITLAISFLTQEKPEEALLDVIFTDQEARCVTVGKTLRHRAQILETVATLKSSQDKNLDSLTPILQTRLPRLSGCFCIFINIDDMRHTVLKMLVQQGIPTTAIFLCDQNIRQQINVGKNLASFCRTHVIDIDNIQQELLSL